MARIPARIVLSLLAASGVMVIYISRVCLSVAILAMVTTVDNSGTETLNKNSKEPYCLAIQAVNGSNAVSNKTIHNIYISDNVSALLDSSLQINSTDNNEEDDSNENVVYMTSFQRGAVLGAFFCGYFITAIPGGRLADIYGTKRVFGTAVFVDGSLSFLIPLATKTHYTFLIAVRVLMGLAQGVCYPSLHALMARWIPPVERPRFIGFTYFANSVSIVLTMPLTGITIGYLGWEAIFYICGGISYCWVLLWTLLMYDTPERHPRISEGEKKLIIDAITSAGTDNKPKSVHWKAVLTSIPVWAISVSHAGNMYVLNLLITQLPTYMSSVIGLSIKKNAALSSLPFIGRYIGGNTFGWIGSTLIKRNIITVAFARKYFNTAGMSSAAIILSLFGFVGCNPYVSMGLMTLGTFLNVATSVGYLSNHLDIAPNLAGTLFGITNTFGFGVAMLSPIICGALTPTGTMQEWRIVFLIAAAISLVSCLFFFRYHSTELQPWNFDQGVDSKYLEDPELTRRLSAFKEETGFLSARTDSL